MLQEITEREVYLLFRFRGADIQKRHLVAETLRIPLSEKEAREAIELYLSRNGARPGTLEREVLGMGFAKHNEECTEMLQLFIDKNTEPAEV